MGGRIASARVAGWIGMDSSRLCRMENARGGVWLGRRWHMGRIGRLLEERMLRGCMLGLGVERHGSLRDGKDRSCWGRLLSNTFRSFEVFVMLEEEEF